MVHEGAVEAFDMLAAELWDAKKWCIAGRLALLLWGYLVHTHYTRHPTPHTTHYTPYRPYTLYPAHLTRYSLHTLPPLPCPRSRKASTRRRGEGWA